MKMQETICAIILTKNEEVHLERILDQIQGLMDHILIIDSGSTDKTAVIAKDFRCEFLTNKWKNHATQFNFGIDYLQNRHDWILRVDADEYFQNIDLLIKVINQIKDGYYKKFNGISLNRRIMFLGNSIRYGGIFPIRIIRIFRSKFGICENRWMDEHIVVDGKTVHENIMIIDDNKMEFDFWLNKHVGYAKKEALEMLFVEYGLKISNRKIDYEAGRKRYIKDKIYIKLPLFLRPILYFMYRYFIRFGFLDGKIGFLYHFFHAFWYRLVVDVLIYRVKLVYNKNQIDIKTAIKQVLKINA